jgi:hypothetical protein
MRWNSEFKNKMQSCQVCVDGCKALKQGCGPRPMLYVIANIFLKTVAAPPFLCSLLGGCPPPAGRTRGVPAGSTAGPTSFFPPRTPMFYIASFCISFSFSFTFASVPARVILNNRYTARWVPAGYTAGLPTGVGHPQGYFFLQTQLLAR